MLIDDQSPTSQKSRFLSNDICDTRNENAGFSQSTGSEHSWAKSSQSRDNSNKQKRLKLPGFLEDSHKNLKINEYL